eukprot:GHVP01017422.1.p1 GENE.GHVP01017422.1~~GHVP01017422.1.p1  ORF type:complete len:344 (+),score=71.12 GHVP01017422.1:339-1370(+)
MGKRKNGKKKQVREEGLDEAFLKNVSSDPEELYKQIIELKNQIPNVRNNALKKEISMKVRHLVKHRRALIRRARKEREEKTGIKEPRPEPKNIDTNLRAPDETIVKEGDAIIQEENEEDEFAPYFENLREPKLMLTSGPKPSRRLKRFMMELIAVIPNLEYYERERKKVKNFIEYAKKHEFTDVIVLIERCRRPYGMYISHLPYGPTSFFRVSSVTLAQEMKDSGSMTNHKPELVLNNFDTRLGHRLGRQIASLFPQRPEFEGRRVLMFHNQRDFVFFRHYRYDFRDKEHAEVKGKRTALHEVGPRFTLKLRWMHLGTFNTKEAKYEFMWRPDLQTRRNVQFI